MTTDHYDDPHIVYVHRAADGAVLYVGCTLDLEQRTASHRTQAAWWSRVDEVTVDSVQPNKLAGLGRERQLIVELEPPYNRTHNPALAREAEAHEQLARLIGGSGRVERFIEGRTCLDALLAPELIFAIAERLGDDVLATASDPVSVTLNLTKWAS